MVRNAARHKLSGVMNTAWCPHRYITNALYYAIAYSAYMVEHNGDIRIGEFRNAFTKYMFSTDCSYSLDRFLSLWPRLNITGDLASKLLGEDPVLTGEDEEHLREINVLGRQAFKHAARFKPCVNHDIWHAMVLSARVAWICSEGHFAAGDKVRHKEFHRALDEIIAQVEQEWDRTRCPDDPHKYATHFNEARSKYLIPILQTLRQRCA